MSRLFIITLITVLVLSVTCQGTYDSDEAGVYVAGIPTNDDDCDTCNHGHLHVGHVHDHGHIHAGYGSGYVQPYGQGGGYIAPYGQGGGYIAPYGQGGGYWNWPYDQGSVPYAQGGGYWNGPYYGR